MIDPNDMSNPAAEPRAGARRADSLRERVIRSRPELRDKMATTDAAVILLLSVDEGQKIDRLARFAGCSREVVARHARRLHDNGVWSQGGILRDWSTERDPSFWWDVAVAEGRMYRKATAAGTYLWAPVGCWWKQYDLDLRGGDYPTMNSYHDASIPLPLEPDGAADGSAFGEAICVDDLSAPGVSLKVAPAERDPPSWLGGPASGGGRHRVEGGVRTRLEGVVADLFPDAIWLG
jgi:hypothetical protein